MRVLIAEDNRTNRISLVSFLKEMGTEVFVADNGLDALKIWESNAPHILITDLRMPLLDGISLIEKVRGLESDSYTYIIVLTIDQNLETLEKAFEAGADDYLIKPFIKRELIHRIKAAERIIGLFEKQLIIFALAQLTETRDLNTGIHIDRISGYCKLLARSLKENPKYAERITGRFIEDISLSSALHDIGKVGIDDVILNKPGVFTEEERNIMKSHTLIGSDTISSIQKKYPHIKFLNNAIDIARSHHEWFDGTGYPDGSKKEEIPLSARIVALADVYEALRSQRVYKNKMTHEEAKKILLAESGTHFDPDIIEAFLRVENSFVALEQKTSDSSND